MRAPQKMNACRSSSKRVGGKLVSSSHPSSSEKSIPDVDETLLFIVPDGTDQMQQIPTQPGVLPLWDADEDLLK